MNLLGALFELRLQFGLRFQALLQVRLGTVIDFVKAGDEIRKNECVRIVGAEEKGLMWNPRSKQITSI